jgi:Spy/CpxP family protein refolding chaperone
MIKRRHLFVGILALASVLTVSVDGFAQGKGGGGAKGIAMPSARSRLDTLEVSFKLTKDQKKALKLLLDDAHKSAAPTREGLTRTRAAIAAAIQGNQSQADIDAAVKSYAEQATVMTTIEMKALADLMKALDAEQRANKPAIATAFFMMRGAFLDPKKWDDIPDGRLY